MENKKYKLVALFGPSCSGKDTLVNYVVNNSDKFHKIVSYTTRAKRDYEQEGIDYYFTDAADFAQRVMTGDIVEATSWLGELYGSSISTYDIDKINIAVLDTEGIECLSEDSRIDLIPIFIAVEDKTRLLRSLQREKTPDCEKICRRFLEDSDRFNTHLDFDYQTYYNGEKVAIENFLTYLNGLDTLSQN